MCLAMRLAVLWRFLVLSALWQERGHAQLILPDVVAATNETFHGHLPSTMVAAPTIFLPTNEELEKLSDVDTTKRQHFYFSAFLFSYSMIVGAGTGIMVFGPKCKGQPGYESMEAPGKTKMLSKWTQKLLVGAVFGMNFLIGLTAAVWSLSTGRLSKKYFMDWEILLALFLMNGSWMLVQACVAVGRVPAERVYGSMTFAEGTLTSMMPVLSDAYDTLKDITFGALCIKSTFPLLKKLGVMAWLYLLAIHVFFIFFDDTCSAELAAAYLPVLLAATEPKDGAAGQSEDAWYMRVFQKILPILLKQTTPAKRKLLLIENLPQAIFAIFYMLLEGGYWLVAVMNVAMPAVQYILGWMLHKPLASILAPWFARKLDAALEDGNALAALQIHEAGDFSNDQLLFRAVAGQCRALRRAFPELEHADLPTGRMNELQSLLFDTLNGVLNRIGKNIVDVSPFGRALEVNVALEALYFAVNQIVDVSPLGQALQVNATLQVLYLNNNQIVDVNPLGQALQVNATLQTLSLHTNRITDAGPLGRALETNKSLRTLKLTSNPIADKDVFSREARARVEIAI